METVIVIPDAIAQHIASNSQELERQVKLAYALRLYRENKITEHEFGEMLGLETRMEIDAVLKENDCFIEYTKDEITAQQQALREVLGK
jgi:predicted HTH domain antitoxin